MRIARRVYRRPTGTLRVTVSDAETGQLTDARIQLRASDGKAYTPSDSYHRVAARALHQDFFHTDGEFSLELPVGDASILAMNGFERYPETATVRIEPGAVTSLSLELQRFTDMAALAGTAAATTCT